MLMRSFLGHSLIIAFLGAAVGCTGPDVGSDGGESCTTDLDCDDGHECTIDSCGVSNLCRHDEVDERCTGDLVCEAGRGCVSSASCASDADCDDGHACTTDSCGVGGICNHTPVNERCAAGETCDIAMGCVAPTGACASDADCNDDVACTRDTCAADLTCSNTALDEMCDTAAGERCSATAGCFVPMPCTTADDCQDGNFCNGAEVCTAEFGCAPAEAPRTCDDSNDCTVDSCDASSDMCVFACDPTRGPECMAMCPPPAAGCNGRFRLTGSTSVSCSIFSSLDFSEATFELADGVLSISPRAYTTTPAPPGGFVMTDEAAPLCPEFDASERVPGGCVEDYRLRGTFTDDDNFTGTLEWTFTGGDCVICGATSGSNPVTGTRIP